MWRLALGAVLVVAACSTTRPPATAPLPTEGLGSEMEGPRARVQVDRDRHQVVVVLGPFRVPSRDGAMEMDGHEGADHHDAGMRTPLLPFEWPVDAGFQGFTVQVFDGDGNLLSRDLMHHMIGVNFARRQLVYPVAERLFAIGTETADVHLPDAVEVPMSRGDRIGVYAMWNNQTGTDLPEVYAQIVLPYAPDDGKKREAVLPIYVDTHYRIGGTTAFDLPPGRVVKSYEFTLPVGGALLAASGHLHDYGHHVRLEDAETGKVLFRVESRLDEDGQIQGIETRVFRKLFGLVDDRIRLEPGRSYRVVAEYHNPTGERLEEAAMAHIVGLFAPDDYGAWPELDPLAEAFRKDLSGLPAPGG